MTEKDIRARFQRETGKYVPCLTNMQEDELDYVEWLEQQFILTEKELYDLKLEKLKQNWTSQNRAY